MPSEYPLPGRSSIPIVLHDAQHLPRLHKVEERLDLGQVGDLVRIASRDLEHPARADREFCTVDEHTYRARDAGDDLSIQMKACADSFGGRKGKAEPGWGDESRPGRKGAVIF